MNDEALSFRPMTEADLDAVLKITLQLLVPFLAGCVFAMVMAFFFRLRRRRL